MKMLLLIDGSSLLSTSFYGNIPKQYFSAKTDEAREEVLKKVMQTSRGEYTNGVYTFFRTLLKIIEKQKPSHLAVAWDISRNTFRKQLYPQYKAQRDETKPELKSQFQLTQDALEAMNIKQFMLDDYEADDIIGTLAKQFEGEIPVYIYTKDQDALQLVSDNTRLWLVTSKAKEMNEEAFGGLDKDIVGKFNLPDNVFEFTPIWVEEIYGLSPSQIIDKKALEGDKSDNIPGVRGIGEKVSIPLIKEFGTIENLYEHIEGLSKAEEKEMKEFFKLLGISRSPLSYLLKESKGDELSGKEAALLSKKLATINTSVPELKNVKLIELELSIDEAGMNRIFEYLEFKSLLKKATA